jgi:hypothetical protein
MNTQSVINNNTKSTLNIPVNKKDRARWYATNDGVMGGLSEGVMAFNQEHGIFTGTISLANNGGFSSVYRVVENVADETNIVMIDIEGDGQTYQLRLVLNINGYRVAYKHDFATQMGVREQITFSLDDFRASFRGRIIRDAPSIHPHRIKEVGFLIANKIPGTFALAVYNISFLKSNITQLVQEQLATEGE